MQQKQIEYDFLLAMARMDPPADLATRLQQQATNLDWTLLVETAYAHGVTGLLCHNLLKLPREQIPDTIIEAAIQHQSQTSDANQALLAQLLDILGRLSDAGIEAIPFKGPTLALKAYGDLSLRSFRDLDFLIQKQQVDVCLDTLSSIGYCNPKTLTARQWQAFVDYAGQEILFGHGVPVEPHWAFAPSTLTLNFDYDALWSRRQSYRLNGNELLSFAVEDELLILCVHGCKERWLKLKWLCDLNKFVHRHQSLDWELFLSRAQEQGLMRVVLLSLQLAHTMLDLPLPDPAASHLRQDNQAKRLAHQLSESFFKPRNSGQSIYQVTPFHWRMRERPRDRWRYLLRTLTQPRTRHFADLNLPDSLFFLYTPYKILHDYLLLPAWLGFKRLRGEKTGNPLDPEANRKPRDS